MSSNQKRVVHPYPVWRSRANFLIVGSWYRDEADLETREDEQLWARHIDSVRFEICCIPFLIRNLALGDQVQTDTGYRVSQIVRPFGHRTFRVLFENIQDEAAQLRVSGEVTTLGCLFEWSSERHFAIDAATTEQAWLLEDHLRVGQDTGEYRYERGFDTS